MTGHWYMGMTGISSTISSCACRIISARLFTSTVLSDSSHRLVTFWFL